MKKQAVILTVFILIIGGLLAALVLLRGRPPAEPPPTMSMIGSIEVYSFEAPVAEVAVRASDGSADYTVVRLPEDSGGGDPIYMGAVPFSTLSGREELPLDFAKTNEVLTWATGLIATQLLYEQSDNYAAFGLTDPSRTVKITDINGMSKTLLIGNPSPDPGSYYVQVQGEPAIYLVPIYRLSICMQPETSYMAVGLTKGSPADFYTAQQLTLGGRVREELGEILISPVTAREATPMDLHTHMLRSPVLRPLNVQEAQYELLTLFGLQADSVAAIYPDEKLLAEYGLDQPYATASVKNRQAGDFTLKTGEPDGTGSVYIMRDGVPLVYRIREELLPWLSVQFDDYMSRNVTTLYLDEVDEIHIDTGDEFYRFYLDHSDIGRLAIYIDGREAHRSNFMTFCETLRKARYEELTFDPIPAGTKPILQVTVTYVYGGPEKHFAFYPGPSRRYFVDAGEMEGYRYYTSSLYVDRALAEVVLAALPNNR